VFCGKGVLDERGGNSGFERELSEKTTTERKERKDAIEHFLEKWASLKVTSRKREKRRGLLFDERGKDPNRKKQRNKKTQGTRGYTGKLNRTANLAKKLELGKEKRGGP